ncbi:MAG: regulatory protein RecX [Oscillochloridaceae bacterium umkhey_bin13]
MPSGTITAIAAQAHDSQRVNIFVDGTFALGVSLTTLAREGLYVGLQLDAAAWARLEAAAQAERALQAALRLLDTRPRSSTELQQRLRQKQHPPDAIREALSHLRDLGLLDDAAFSRYLVESRQRARPRGSAAIRAELQRKGVERATIDEALAATDADPAAEAARAEQVARTALPRYANSADWLSFQRRLGGLLQRRGFSLTTIRPILAILWQELHQTPGDLSALGDDE